MPRNPSFLDEAPWDGYAREYLREFRREVKTCQLHHLNYVGLGRCPQCVALAKEILEETHPNLGELFGQRLSRAIRYQVLESPERMYNFIHELMGPEPMWNRPEYQQAFGMMAEQKVKAEPKPVVKTRFQLIKGDL